MTGRSKLKRLIVAVTGIAIPVIDSTGIVLPGRPLQLWEYLPPVYLCLQKPARGAGADTALDNQPYQQPNNKENTI
jgi:hypothetical protein